MDLALEQGTSPPRLAHPPSASFGSVERHGEEGSRAIRWMEFRYVSTLPPRAWPFNEVLQHYALNRFLYRLGQSAHRERLILKGALVLAAWDAPITRPTRDIDLLGRMENRPESVTEAIRELCGVVLDGDGLRFDAASLATQRIIEGDR